MSPPIRVAHLVGSTGLYGAERWILTLLKYLPRDHVQATLLNLVDVPGPTSDVVRAATEQGMPAMDFHTGGRFNPASLLRLAALVAAHGYQVLHSHGYKADALALFAARRNGVTFVSTPHGWDKIGDTRIALYEALDRLLLRFADHVCPLSPDLYDTLKRSGIPARKLRLVMNAVDLDGVDSSVSSPGHRSGDTVIGFVGRLITLKNVECLIAAIQHVARARLDVHLTIVGDGPLRGRLQAMTRSMGVGDRITFSGYRPDAIAVLKTFDIFVLPSWTEGLPRALMEAMAASIPAIASDVPGNRALIEDGVTGLLFPPDRSEQLARAITTMLDHPVRAKEMAQRARAKIERDFSAQRMAQDYSTLYQECSTSSS